MFNENMNNDLITQSDKCLIPYKNINKLVVKKYHIVDSNNKIIKHKICNVFAPFGREADYNKFESSQQRFNICFTLNDVNDGKNKSYEEFINTINHYEQYFKEYDELKEFELISNIINRGTYGNVIRCHLKTIKDKTTSKLIQIRGNNKISDVEWIEFDKNLHFNMEYCFDCLWIDEKNKKFGISIQVLSVFQVIP